jgi:xanthine dehydrogenase YagR molybdenum-binding subunit
MNSSLIGQGLDRVDGRDKVCGRATFAAEFSPVHVAHAVLVTSSIAKGRIVRMNVAAAENAKGVLAVMTPSNAPRLPQNGRAAIKPPAGRALALLQDDQVSYSGQPIGVVIAETLEQATAAARLVEAMYEQAYGATNFELAKATAHAPDKLNDDKPDSIRGDPDGALASAFAVHRATYSTPVEHHNPMEPHATVAAWRGNELTVWDSTQYVSGVKETMAKTLGIPPESVTVISPFVGGGFGCKGSMWSHVALAAMAARRVDRPVKLAIERPQMFAFVGNRPRTEQRVAIGAANDGTFIAMRHDTVSETSQIEDWAEPCGVITRMLYKCSNLATTHRIAPMNVGTPTFMRAPGESSGSFALETAVDEMAVRLGMDPIELRLRNYADRDGHKDKPFSSKSLRECYRAGAERFDWQRRTAQGGGRREGPWRVGFGMATASYPANRSAAEAVARLLSDGTAVVQSGSQDIGTGTYTVMTQVAAQTLGLPVERARFELGDSRLPKAPVSGGSQSVASVAPAVQAACAELRAKLLAFASSDLASPLHGQDVSQLSIADGWVSAADGRKDSVAALAGRHGKDPLVGRASVKPGDEKDAYSMHSFGAIFAEVAVDDRLGVVRLRRLIGAYAVGNVLNAKTARSQLLGGMVWGAGMALFEESLRDPRDGRVVNANLAEYHVPVNADIAEIDVIFVPESDALVNPLGAKGIGEIGITGVAAAIGNAVFNATGVRVRDLPITLDKLMTPAD